MRQYKAHDERFANYYITPTLHDFDEEGYGKAIEWLVKDKSGNVLYKARKLTEARLKARALNKSNK